MTSPCRESVDACRADGSAGRSRRRKAGFHRSPPRHCAWDGVNEGVVRLRVEHGARHLLNDDRRRILERALSVAGSAILSVEFCVVDDQVKIPSPVQREREQAAERQLQAEQEFANDPVVREFQRQFDATIRPGSVRPLD